MCEEFDELLEAQNAREMRSFALVLDDNWKKRFSDKDITRPTCKLMTTSGQILKTEYSSFYLKV